MCRLLFQPPPLARTRARPPAPPGAACRAPQSPPPLHWPGEYPVPHCRMGEQAGPASIGAGEDATREYPGIPAAFRCRGAAADPFGGSGRPIIITGARCSTAASCRRLWSPDPHILPAPTRKTAACPDRRPSRQATDPRARQPAPPGRYAVQHCPADGLVPRQKRIRIPQLVPAQARMSGAR